MGFNKALILSGFVISLVFIGITGLILSLGSNYDTEVPEEYQEIFDEYEETQTLYESQSEIIEGGDVNPEGQDQAIYKNVVVAAKESQQSANLLIRLLNQASRIIGIPAAMVFIIISIIFSLATFGFIYLVSGRNP